MKIYPGLNNGKPAWVVDWRTLGKRHRKFFNTQTAAKTFASHAKKEVSDYGEEWSRLAGWERAMVIQAHRRASEHGYTLTDACECLERTRAQSGVTVEQLCNRCLLDKQERQIRPESLRQVRAVFDLFKVDFGQSPASTITPTQIAEFLKVPTWGPRRRLGVLKELRALWNYGERFDLVATNPAKKVSNPILEVKPPKILSVEQAVKLMVLAKRQHPRLIPYLAVTLFAGLRDAEARRLRWADVDFGRGLIRLASEQTKTRSRRLVPMHDTCATWLTLESKRTGMVFRGVAALREVRKALKLSKNVLRHSYISYELARTENEEATALRAGTSPRIIHAHYRELVTPDAAQKFWEILPLQP